MKPTDRQVCTAEHPMPEHHSGYWCHPSAREIGCTGGYPDGDVVTYVCPHCGLRFKQELPQ